MTWVDGNHWEDRAKDFLSHDRGVEGYVFNDSRFDKSLLCISAASVDDVSVLEVTADSFKCFVTHYAYIVLVCFDVFAMEF